MASLQQQNRNDAGEHKASSLPDSNGNLSKASETAAPDARKDKHPTDSLKRRTPPTWRSIVLDILLLLLLGLVVVGAIFAYRALRELYAPAKEERKVVFTVTVENLDAAEFRYDPDLLPFRGKAVYSDITTNADYLGTVTHATAVAGTNEDGKPVYTLILTVEATARYGRGEGYWMGNTRLLAGAEGTYRLHGLTVTGTVTSLQDLTTEAETPTELPADTSADTAPTVQD